MITSDAAQLNPEALVPEDQGIQPNARDEAFSELEDSVSLALKTYSNVHRGTGAFSMVTTRLYERAREIVLDHLGLDTSRSAVVFCTPERQAVLEAALPSENFISLSSEDIGLPLGVRALAVEKDALPKGVPFQTGGGTTKMVSRGSVIWEEAPDRFEAGTPAIINVIAFARALQITRRSGPHVFAAREASTLTAFEILHDDDLRAFSGRRLLHRLRRAGLGRDVDVPTADGPRPATFLDNAASTPTFTPVWEAVRRTWKLPRRERLRLISEVKRTCARFLNMPPDRYDLIFTSNTTEAINLVARSLSLEPAAGGDPVVLNTLLEHNSNELPWRFASGVSLVRAPVDDEGFVDMDELEKLLRAYNLDGAHGKKRIRIVSVSGASNVLGTWPDIREIGRVAHKYQARLLVDAAQLAGHRKIDMEGDDIDYLAFSGHKMYAPFGSGVLVARKGLLEFGPAEWEKIRSSGEENAVGISALGKAVDLLQRVGMDVIREEELRLTRMALSKLATVPGIEIFGIRDPDSPRFPSKGGVISFGLQNVPHNLVAEKLAELGGIGVRSGCFCAHLLVKRLLRIHPAREALANLGLRLFPKSIRSVLPGLVRVSFGLVNDERDVDHLVKILKRISARPVSRLSRLLARTHNATPLLPSTEARKDVRAFVEALARDVYGPDDAAIWPWHQRCCHKH